MALCRPDVVVSWLSAMASYCEAEDVPQAKFLADSVAARKEYRRVKVASL